MTTRPLPLRCRVICIVVMLVASFAVVASVDESRAIAEEFGRDYASEAFGNPWDYSDAADIIIGDGPMRGVDDAEVARGVLRFSTRGAGYISPLWGGYPNALHAVNDGAARPIDTTRYARIAFRITSNTTLNAGIRWYTCADGDVQDSCQGGFAFDIAPGTHTYDFALVASNLDPALATPWSGLVTGLRLAFNGNADLSLDWFSVYGGAAPHNDGPRTPAPRILDPDIEGGVSLGPRLRGKEWDMTAPSDVSRLFNVNGSVRSGAFVGQNDGPQTNDPALVLNLACRTFRADQFHRFTVDLTYDGPFSVEDRPGGGMNQRLIWRTAGTPLTTDGRDLQNSDDMVIYPGRRRYSVDLRRNPPESITDTRQNGPRMGWVGEIEHLRFDPNEDRGGRRWRVHSIKLAADDLVAPGGRFAITWTDTNYAPGGTATIALSPASNGERATVIADGVPVREGANTTPWVATGAGSYWVVVTIRRGGLVSEAVSTGPLTIGSLDPSFGVNQRGVDGTRSPGEGCGAAKQETARVRAQTEAQTKAQTKAKSTARSKAIAKRKRNAKSTPKRASTTRRAAPRAALPAKAGATAQSDSG